jgi:hypothetical protein
VNVIGSAAPSTASSCSISGVWRWRSTLYGVMFSSAEMKWVVGDGERPAPETPDFASITTSAIAPARASGASPSSAAVG